MYGFLNYFIIAQLYSGMMPYMYIYDYASFAGQKKNIVHRKGEEDTELDRNTFISGPLEGGTVGKGYSV